LGRKSRLESLETRLALAAVSADVFGNGLVILGGNAADQVGVTLDGEEIVVAALDASTLINGAPEARFDAAAIYNVRVDLGAGDNVLAVGGEDHEEEPMGITAAAHEDDDHEEEARLTIPGNLMVTTDFGDDTIRIRFTNISGNVTVETGAGADTADVGRGPGFGGEDHEEETAIAALLSNLVSAEAEEEEGCEDGGPPPDVQVGGRLTIRTDSGDDGIKVGFTSVGERVVIFSGDGADHVVTGRGPIRGVHGPGQGECEGEDASSSAVTFDEGDDHEGGGNPGGPGGGGGHDGGEDGHDGGSEGGRPVDVRVAGDTTINVGPGDDFVMLRNIEVNGGLSVSSHAGRARIGTQNVHTGGASLFATGAGHDILALLDSHFGGPLSIGSGPGNDLVLIDNSRFQAAVDVALGSFHDQLALRDSTFESSVKLDGGSGSDNAAWEDADLHNIFAVQPIEKSIESHDLDVAAIAALIMDEETGFGLFLQGRSGSHGGGGHGGGGHEG
jgi:hypothetical protein